MGLNLGSAGAWGVVGACAATLQLERLAFSSREMEAAAARTAALAERRARTKELNARKARTVSAAAERAGKLQLAKEEKEEEGSGGGGGRNPRGTRRPEPKRETKAKPTLATPGRRVRIRRARPSVVRPPSVSMGWAADLTVKQLGRALGAAQVNATRLRARSRRES